MPSRIGSHHKLMTGFLEITVTCTKTRTLSLSLSVSLCWEIFRQTVFWRPLVGCTYTSPARVCRTVAVAAAAAALMMMMMMTVMTAVQFIAVSQLIELQSPACHCLTVPQRRVLAASCCCTSYRRPAVVSRRRSRERPTIYSHTKAMFACKTQLV